MTKQLEKRQTNNQMFNILKKMIEQSHNAPLDAEECQVLLTLIERQGEAVKYHGHRSILLDFVAWQFRVLDELTLSGKRTTWGLK